MLANRPSFTLVIKIVKMVNSILSMIPKMHPTLPDIHAKDKFQMLNFKRTTVSLT